MSLYNFTTATFTPGSATGRFGPNLTQARSGLSGPEVVDWKDNTDFFNVDNGIQLWTVPKTGLYRIDALGGRGSGPDGYSADNRRGFGARIAGDVVLSEGEIIRILVGHQGNPWALGGHAGGGGTFVVRTPYNTNGSILVIAGAGGGHNSTRARSGGDAVVTNNGGTAPNGGAAAGTEGSGGGSGGSGTGGGGGGFFGNGQSATTSGGNGGSSFINGGAGGTSNTSSVSTHHTVGAFGGGGGGTTTDLQGGGGGGGYSGGSGGSFSGGGGGGSFNSGLDQLNIAGINDANGEVTITYIEQKLYTDKSFVQVGETFTITLLSLDSPDNTNIPYTISGVTSADINNASLTGNFIIINGTASLEVTATATTRTNKIFSISAASSSVEVFVSYLLVGTQPSVGGTAELTDVVTVTPRIEIPEATDLATTGVFTLSEARPTLTNVEAFNVLESIPEINISSQVQWFQLVADAIGTPAVASTRQLLIR